MSLCSVSHFAFHFDYVSEKLINESCRIYPFSDAEVQFELQTSVSL